MQYFTEQALSQREALEKVREKYGESAQVLSHRTIRMGGFMGLFAREGVEVSGYIRPEAKAAARPPADLEEEKRKILSMAGAQAKMDQAKADQAMQTVLAELRGIKESIDEMPRAAAEPGDHLAIRRVDALLAANEFSEPYRREIVARLRREFTLEGLEDEAEVQQEVLCWIGDSISIWREGAGASRPRVLALVGPTGVGKTTTIAKLAAIYKVGIAGERACSVRMITIDNYRIGARQQIETYGSIMELPVSCVETAEELKKTIAFHSDADLILVDTVGKSPRDAIKLAEMQRILAACGPAAELHLALTATMKASDMAQAMRQFEPFDYKAVIVTKLDETERIGNVISALAERRKPISYVTDGQKVPQDIDRARVARLLMNLEGFRVDRARLEARFGEAGESLAGRPGAGAGAGAAAGRQGDGQRVRAERS